MKILKHSFFSPLLFTAKYKNIEQIKKTDESMKFSNDVSDRLG